MEMYVVESGEVGGNVCWGKSQVGMWMGGHTN